MPDDILREELARMLGSGDGPEASDALDALWIARLSGLAPVDMPLTGTGPDREAGAPPAAVPPEPPRSHPRPGEDPAVPSARLHLPTRTGSPVRGGGAWTLRVAQPAALPAVLDLNRALRPLRRVVPSSHVRVLDVRATAAATGDTGLLLPVLRPALERRFSVDLLIDSGTTMAVWHRLGVELRTLLERHGAFAAVRAWALHTDGPEPCLAPFRRGNQSRNTTRRWRQHLSDATGRRLVLVLTDGVGPAWYGTELPAALAQWSEKRPVAVLQVLPSRLWHRTALRPAPVRARGTDGPRPTLQYRTSARLPGIPRGRAGAADRDRIRWLPVLEVAGPWLAPWAELVSGDTTDWTRMLATPLTVVDRPRPPDPAEEPATPAEWIGRFEAGYSVEAFRLLRLLAAAPLSLPVMRLVQRTLLRGSTPMHLAEIFLSGLLVRRTPARPGEDPDTVQYDFRDGVREALLARLTRTESLRVFQHVMAGVGERVSETFGGVTDFAALAATGATGDLGGLELPEGSRPFAEVALTVIRRAGGDYVDVVERLERGAEGGETAVTRRGTWWRGIRPRWLGGSGQAHRPGRQEGGGEGRRPGAPAEPAASPVTGPVPHHVPGPPEGYVRRDGTEHVVEALLRGDGVCLISGAEGVGKTVLAAACAAELADEFTLVRWIRADSRTVMMEDLTALARDLHVPGNGPGEGGVTAFLSRLRTRLHAYSRWLLVLDGVAEYPAYVLDALRRPGSGGSILVTLTGTPLWPSAPEVTLDEFSRGTAVAYARSFLGPDHGALWETDHELTDLIEVLGTHPGTLAQRLSHIRSRRTPVADVIRDELTGRPEITAFLRSLVPVLSEGRLAGTGVVVEPDAVLVPDTQLPVGVFEIPFDGHYTYSALLAARNRTLRATLLDVPGAVHLHRVPHVGSTGTPVTAAWYAPSSTEGTPPALHVRPVGSRPYRFPPGAALIDARGALCALATSAGSSDHGPRVSPFGRHHLDILLAGRSRRPQPVHDPLPGSPAQDVPYFYLSYAHTPPGTSEAVLELHERLSEYVSELAELPEGAPAGFVDRRIPVGAEWEPQLKQALSTARVLVPLYSPRYFSSEWCGMEWQAFQRREEAHGPRRTVRSIVPVLWTGAGDLRVPRVASGIQYVDGDFHDDYVHIGLLGLRGTGNAEGYRRAVRAIARSIVRVADTTGLRPCDPALLDDLTSAFAEDDATPSSGP